MTNRITKIAQTAFCLGLVISLWDLIDRNKTVASFHIGLLNPELTIALASALVLWFIGDILLFLEAHEQFRKDKETLAYLLQQVNCLAAGLLALAPIPHWSDIATRSLCAIALTYVLFHARRMEPGTIVRALVPFIWWRKIWAGDYGPTAGWLVGTELMAWGVSLLGVSTVVGWGFLALANLWLARWNWLDMKQGAKVEVWLRINLAFMSVATIQTLWALRALWF